LFDGPASIVDLPVWGEAAFVLRNKGTSVREAGGAVDEIRAESAYHRLLTFTSLVVDDNGTALTADDARVFARLDGLPFERAVAELRAAGE